MFKSGDRVMIINKAHDVLLLGDTGKILITGLMSGAYKPYSTVKFDRTKVMRYMYDDGLIKI